MNSAITRPLSLCRSCQALGSMPALRSLHMEDCPQLTARAIAGLTGLTVRRNPSPGSAVSGFRAYCQRLQWGSTPRL